MAEFTLDGFVNRIREVLYDNFPYEDDEINKKKHKGRTGHIKDIAFKDLPVSVNMQTRTFDIGSEYAEMVYPYYHILQDSEVIHIKGHGTKGSKGSQDRISDKSARDYGRVTWNGKTFTQEYSKNVRGSRSRSGKARRYMVDSNGVVYKINANANTYVNIHYKYIDRILNETIPFIAQEFNLRPLRTKISGLGDEFAMQQEQDIENITDILDSFTEGYYD